jgi:hypothetical protein
MRWLLRMVHQSIGIGSYLGQLVLVLAESETPEVEVNVAVPCPQAVDSLGVLVEKTAPRVPPPPVAVELLTDPVS